MIETMTNEEKYQFLINQIINIRTKNVYLIQKFFINSYNSNI